MCDTYVNFTEEFSYIFADKMRGGFWSDGEAWWWGFAVVVGICGGGGAVWRWCGFVVVGLCGGRALWWWGFVEVVVVGVCACVGPCGGGALWW